MRKLAVQTYNGIEVFLDADSATLYAAGVPLKLERAGTIYSAASSRYILVACLVSIGATIFWFTDINVAVFDTTAKTWTMYQNFAHEGRINDAKFALPNIQWTVDFHAHTRQRTFDPATGAMGAINDIV